MDRLRSLHVFVTVADLGTFNRAARLLGVSPQAVSKAVRQLEGELGVRLFHRSTRSSMLTEEGARFLAQVRGGVEALNSAWAQAQASQSSAGDHGLIRVACGSVVARRMLVPLLAQFRQQHPGAEFDLVVEDRFTEFVAAGIDVGFRGGYPPDAQVICRELFRMQLVVCASPAYLAQHGVPTSVRDLARHTCTGFRLPNTGRVEPWVFSDAGQVSEHTVLAPLYTNDPDTELCMVQDGQGIGQLDTITASEALRSGQVIPLLCDQVSERYGLFMYYAQRTQMPRRVRAFIDFAASWPGLGRFRFSQAELQQLQAAWRATQ